MSRSEPPPLEVQEAHIEERMHVCEREYRYIVVIKVGLMDEAITLDTGWTSTLPTAVARMRKLCEVFRDKLAFNMVHNIVVHAHKSVIA